MIFFTSDQHFDHENIIRHCSRPFSSLREMNETLIKNWNSVVKKTDTVYVLGDFSFAGPANINKVSRVANILNGEKILVLGNHDRLSSFQYIDVGFNSVHTSLTIELFNSIYFLTHDPAIATVIKSGHTILCGHIHNLFHHMTANNGNIVFNVGVDVNEFKPVSITQIDDICCRLTLER